MEKDFIDLLTLQREIRLCLEDSFPEEIWIRAEVSAVSVKGGHCYLELCQAGDMGMTAKARAVIWKSRYFSLDSYFRAATGSPLKPGISLLLHASVSYSEIYGLSLNVDDLDPQYTLGEKERQKRECIAKLEEEGLMDMQKQLPIQALPYRLAIVSAPSAAGYGDFCRHLHENEYGFVLHTDLFEASMQGFSAPDSIIDAIDRITNAPAQYDAALIIRGGGSELDLDCFNDYALCRRIANSPIPILTAIGHDRDYHVADMVAFEHVKTPTALADWFLDLYIAEDERITSFTNRLHRAFINRINLMSSQLEVLAARIKGADPRKLLSRGYLLATDRRGVVLRKSSSVKKGDIVNILFADGSLECEVKKQVTTPSKTD